ncbi:rare lipoprotein A [Hyphomicrobium sp. 1Nfss2.1]|uniref:RlpA-like double-psi beta-barrel domain-containing protein n=1 Tax=Hyphomicrobium sp. 1Nfss2.1 TaxID=3413936 RepID=UPI003C7B3D50
MPRKTYLLRSAASKIATRCWRPLPALSAVAALIFTGMAITPPVAEAKSPGSRYCFHGYCHRVGTLAQTDTLVGWRGYVLASYYDSCERDPLNPCGLTSSGAVFRADLPDNAASPLLPDGTVILAYNPDTGDASVLRITNAGPYSGKRKLDVSRAAAEKLGFRKRGVASLVITVLQSPTKAEASYVRRRAYVKVPGHIGKFETVDRALVVAHERFDTRADDEMFAAVPESTSAPEIASVPKPQLAVSPSLASEMVMLRSPPRPISRSAPSSDEVESNSVQLVHGPRPVSRAAFLNQLARTNSAEDMQSNADN